MPMELDELERQLAELHRRQRAESQRQPDELFARSKFKNGAEMLDALADLFGSLGDGPDWAEITAGAQRRGRPRPLNDAWVAAAASRAGCRC